MTEEVPEFFSGIGRFRGEKNYSEHKRIVLDHFFTNRKSNVYCATDNMPGEIWALLMGQYARSNLTARDRLLQLFEDVPKKDETAESLEEIAIKIESGVDISDSLSAHLKKAGKFIDLHGVNYGHASLRDSGTIRICFEGVSQRATKFLESAREGAYQEQSTRALRFSMENIGIPFEIQGTDFESRMKDLNQKSIDLYDEIMEDLPAYLETKFGYLREEADQKIRDETGDENARLPDALWEKAINEKTFDVARSLLPQNVTTSLGMTLNTRRFQDQLTEWRSSEILELNVLGRVAQAEAMKISPTLMKHGNPSGFYEQLPEKRRQLFVDFAGVLEGSNPEYKHYPIESRLISHTPNIEDDVLASILLNGSTGRFSFVELEDIVKDLSFEERQEIARSQFENKKGHEILPKSMEVGSFIFERTYDIGAFRDLQRQRGDRQQIAPYSVFGYHMPKEVGEIKLDEDYVNLMNEVKELYDDVKREGLHGAAEYVPLMANLVRHVTTMDPVQAFYQAKLRAQPAGADSYRSIARSEIKQILGVMPAFDGLVEFDDNEYPLNRLPEAVQGTIDRINAKKN